MTTDDEFGALVREVIDSEVVGLAPPEGLAVRAIGGARRRRARRALGVALAAAATSAAVFTAPVVLRPSAPAPPELSTPVASARALDAARIAALPDGWKRDGSDGVVRDLGSMSRTEFVLVADGGHRARLVHVHVYEGDVSLERAAAEYGVPETAPEDVPWGRALSAFRPSDGVSFVVWEKETGLVVVVQARLPKAEVLWLMREMVIE
ncbi:hypothetical protein LO762_23080 [Actinocorallia sp. API 0066]|uniref:hypothetical protein n=1 Tax=Actinocorallia sp. API 0066 TaxID=2896846 RepID=UPI001E33C05E|nr:hypothetical protein [Actinocorallia sp. API 0066]MCD0452053.1 hypothetical protein [Actinocorallia sp. API 0066]